MQLSYPTARPPSTATSSSQFRDGTKLYYVCCSVLAAAIPVLLTSCHQSDTMRATFAAPEVDVVTVTQRDVPTIKEWVGTLDGYVNAEIRGQVTGYLLRQAYREGAFVRKGDLLFEIDPRPFQAALNEANGRLAQAQSSVQQAEGNLAQNQARLGKAELDVKRYTPLVKTKAISQEEMDNAMQSRLEAQAAVEASMAAIETLSEASPNRLPATEMPLTVKPISSCSMPAMVMSRSGCPVCVSRKSEA